MFAAQAKADTWQLTQSNVDLGVSGNFVSVTVSVTGDTAKFTVDANNNLLGGGSNFGVDKFSFNTALGSITPAEISLQNGWSVNTNQNESSFGSFEFEHKGLVYSRKDPLTFSITDPSITSASQFYAADSKGYHFVAEVAGFLSPDGQTSAFFGDNPNTPRPIPTPEPSAMFLMVSGLAGLAVFKRKLEGLVKTSAWIFLFSDQAEHLPGLIRMRPAGPLLSCSFALTHNLVFCSYIKVPSPRRRRDSEDGF